MAIFTQGFAVASHRARKNQGPSIPSATSFTSRSLAFDQVSARLTSSRMRAFLWSEPTSEESWELLPESPRGPACRHFEKAIKQRQASFGPSNIRDVNLGIHA